MLLQARLVVVRVAPELQDGSRDDEADRGRDEDARDDADVVAGGSECQVGEDRARAGAGGEAHAERHEGRDAGRTAGDHRDDGGRLHQHVGEVDLVDAAEEVDDDRSRRAVADHPVVAEEPEGQQQAQAGTGVGRHHEEDRLALVGRDLESQGVVDALVDDVVEEQDLGRLVQEREQGKGAGVHEGVDPAEELVVERADDRPDDAVGGHDEAQAQEAEREVVDDHLEAGADPGLEDAVDLLDQPRAERSHDHGAQEHRDVGTDDEADRAHRPRDAAAVSVHQLAACEGQEQGQDVGDHRPDGLGEVLVGQPARRDEQGGEQAPGDERPHVGDDHRGEEPAERLDACAQARPGLGREAAVDRLTHHISPCWMDPSAWTTSVRSTLLKSEEPMTRCTLSRSLRS